MRAYLAVIKDSFREALASRVLWILLILTTVLLLLLAPIGLRDEVPSADDEQAASKPEAARVAVTYLGWTIGDTLSMTRKEVMPVVRIWVAGIMDFLVGVLGVFSAILVTAPIIPQTFEAGAIDLLLSKPISRSLLFLTKFLGGCAFILLLGGYFIVGIWLIAGWRFDLWNSKLLLCIPLFLFLFAIYYSVSAAAGVLWRNPVVSIVVTILFWALCFVAGVMKDGIETFSLNPQRLVKLVPAGDSLIGVNERGEVRQWRQSEQDWQDVFKGSDGAPPPPIAIANSMIGPVYDPKTGRLLAVPIPFRGGFGSAAGGATLSSGVKADNWSRRKGTVTPAGTSALFVDPQGRVIVAAMQGLFRLQAAAAAGPDQKESPESFVPIPLDPPAKTDPPYAVAMDPDTGGLAVWSRGTLTLLRPDGEGGYVRLREAVIEETREATAAVVAYSGDTVVMALADGKVLVVGAEELSVRQELRPSDKNAPRFAAAAPGGRWFSVLFHDRTFWLYDAREEKPVDIAIGGQKDISAAAFAGPDTLLLADRGSRVTTYDLKSGKSSDRRNPVLSGLEKFYRYGVNPLYTLFPKPGKLGDVVQYLLEDKSTIPFGPNRNDLAAAHATIDVAGPLWSSFAFLAVVLALTCVYVSRSDF